VYVPTIEVPAVFRRCSQTSGGPECADQFAECRQTSIGFNVCLCKRNYYFDSTGVCSLFGKLFNIICYCYL